MNVSDINVHDLLKEIVSLELHNLPIYFLHATALVCFVSIILSFTAYIRLSKNSSLLIGFLLGIAYLFLFTLSSLSPDPNIKILPTVDYLFMSGILGGWGNSLITFIFIFLANLIAGDITYLPLKIVHYIVIIIGSSLVNHYLISKVYLNMKLKHILQLILYRFLLSEIVPIIILGIGVLPNDSSIMLIIRNFISSFTISASIILSLYVLLRYKIADEKSVLFDPSSGLANRKALQSYLENVATQKIGRTPHSMMFIIIDNFQNLVQTYGYKWIDEYLVKLSKEIKQISEQYFPKSYKPYTFLFSDNAFTIVLRNASKEQVQVGRNAHSLLSALTIFTNRTEDIDLMPSFSVSVFDIKFNEHFDAAKFLRSVAVLGKGSSGKVQFFESDLTKQMMLENKIFNMIKLWIQNNEVPVWVQPKVRLKDSKCVGGEALLRVFNDFSEDYITPFQLIKIAEKFRLNADLEWAIIIQVIKMIKMLPSSMTDICLSVNVTPNMFTIPDFSKRVIKLLQDNDVPFNKFAIEIIETDKFSSTEDVKSNIYLLIKNRIKLSLDDFGTGYSSISLFSQYEFDEMKLDYTMISNIGQPKMNSVIQLCIEWAKIHNVSIVAEGIESEEQRNKLLDMGVSYGQGYLFSKAVPIEEFIAYTLK